MLDVKMNFKKKYQNNEQLLQCELCLNDDLDDQPHVVLCSAVKNNQNYQFNYVDLFSQNIKILKKAISQFESSWNERLKLKLKAHEERNILQDEEVQLTH